MKVRIITIFALLSLLAACGRPPPAPTATAAPNRPTDSAPPQTAEPSASPGADPLLNYSWLLGTTMPSTRSEMPAVALNGRLYVPGGFGGVARLEAYDPLTANWTVLANLPAGRHHLMAAAHGEFLYIFGGSPTLGFGATDGAWRYDPGQDRWEELAPLPDARSAGAAVTLGDVIYVVGGSGGSGELLAYYPLENRWDSLPGPQQPREHVAAVAFDGHLWVIGGRWRGDGELKSVEIYDPSGGWREGPALQTARAGFAAAVVEGRILVAGGEVIFTGSETLGSVELFDPNLGSWAFIEPLPAPVHGVGAATLVGQVYLPGGSDRAGAIDNLGRLQIYGP